MTGKSNKHPWTTELSDFYQFIEASQNFLKRKFSENADLELISQIKDIMEIEKVSSGGNRYQDIKFDSAIYRDIGQIALLKNFLKKYADPDLRRFQKLISIEINGLAGDMNPRTILTSTLPAAIITGLGLATVWTALGSAYFGFDLSKIVVDVFMNKLAGISWLRGVLSIVFVIGGFMGIAWYVTGSYRNQKQILFLKSLDRTITLYLSIIDEPEEA